MGLKFSVSELQRELNFCDSIAKRYLERQSQGRLKSAANDLKLIPATRNKTQIWQIDKNNPLKTKPSLGSSEISGQGHSLQGRLSFKWELRKCDQQTVELLGIASTVISIHEIVDAMAKDDYIIKWHVDIVTQKDAPGPAFHTQVDIDNPTKVDVPRLPSILFSPVDCLDFLLGELYQEEWRQYQSSNNKIRSLAKTQQSRFLRLLQEQYTVLGDLGYQSAWITLKNWVPSDRIFLTE